MGEATVIFPDRAGGEPDLESALFHRKIEFQLATKPFNGFGSGTSDGFTLVTLNPNAETNKAAGSVKNCEKMELFEAGLDPDLSFTINFRRIGAGLSNLGNTCFLNSVLQCLTYTEPLAAYLQSGKHQSSCRKAGFCALCAIQKHVSRALQSTGRILEPKDLVSNLRCISRSFRNARQEDAHEYMVNLLESMHKCCLPSGLPCESPTAYEKSLIHRIFGGRLRSQVKCMQCSFCSNKFDPFLDLSLEIVKADSLIKALAHFTAKEHLDGGFKVYQCQHCKQKVKALKQLTVHKAPHVLAVHLKRFSSHLQGQKIDKRVAFGPTLNLKPFVTGPYDGDLNYTLYGVLVHAGWSTHSGHYYCYVRTSSGMWYSLDDNQVIQVNERTVLEQKAYMLFYVRDRTTFSTKKSVEIVTKENMILNAFKGTASSKFNAELTGKIQNVLIEKKPVEAFSASLSQRVPVMSSSPKKSPSINEFSDDLNVPVGDNCMAFEHDPHAEHLSGPPPTENNLKYHSSLPNSNGNGQVPPTENNLKDHPSLENSSGNGPVQPTENNLKVHSSLPKSSGNGQVPPAENNMNDHSSLPKSSGNGQVPPAENNMNDHSSLLKSSGNVQVGCSSGNTAVDSTMLESHENGTEGPKSVACGVRTNKKPCLKVRKKLLKYHFAATSLSSSIILCSVLRTEKKNQKLRKRHSRRKKDPNLKLLLAGSGYRANSESSVSERSLPTVVECAHSQKKNVESCSVGNKQSLGLQSIVDSLNGSIDPEVRKRIVPDSTTLSTKKPLVLPSTARRPAEDGGWESRQAEVMRMLTRGLDKTIVARWDDIDVSPAEQIVTPAAGPVQIGYIGDEWDEEYDRGKRKKIRGTRIGFDGPNLFQELSTRNLERKRAKLNHSSAENHPFRI